MTYDLATSPLKDAYKGSGIYLVALDGESVRAAEYLHIFDTDGQTRTFAAAHPDCRIDGCVGANLAFYVSPSNEHGSTDWDTSQAVAIWWVRDVIREMLASVS